MGNNRTINNRKTEHIDLCLTADVEGRSITTGFENYTFIHQALPEINFQDITIHSNFLNKPMKTPFLISSMTGGSEKAAEINKNLALAAERNGWAMGLGSTRAAIEGKKYADTFKVRSFAPTIPLFANLGAVQLNYGYGVEECRHIIDLTESDGLVLHLNSIQEMIQQEGDTNFKGLFTKIEALVKQIDVPIGIKEVGWGVNGELAKQFFDIGIAFVDVAGAGGTSWSQVEKLRSEQTVKRKAAEAFSDWGIPTSAAIKDVRKKKNQETLIASGGLKTGVDAAKALALGADLAGFGKAILLNAATSLEAVIESFDRIELELKMAMFGTGVESVNELNYSDLLVKRSSYHQ